MDSKSEFFKNPYRASIRLGSGLFFEITAYVCVLLLATNRRKPITEKQADLTIN